MKFDVIIGNPPYQLKVGPTKTQSIWDKFSFKLMELLEKDGYLSLIHPGGWREPFGSYKNVQDLYFSKNMLYLNINDFEKGRDTFGVQTDYDWFILQNKDYEGTTTINFNDDIELDVDITSLDFIPTENYELYDKLLAKNGEDVVDILEDSSTYDHRKCDDIYGKYEIIYTILKGGKVNMLYSSEEVDISKKFRGGIHKGEFKRSHFIPKVIFTNGSGTIPLVDKNGEYGLSEFAYGIIDKPENLDNIKKALENQEFIDLLNGKVLLGNKYDRKIISCLKKDFWKEFI